MATAGWESGDAHSEALSSAGPDSPAPALSGEWEEFQDPESGKFWSARRTVLLVGSAVRVPTDLAEGDEVWPQHRPSHLMHYPRMRNTVHVPFITFAGKTER